LQPEGTVQTIGLAQIAADHEVWPDTDLVTAVRAGEDSAFEELYRRYYDRVARYVGGFVRDRGRAEDVTQEAFVSALRRLRETDSEIAFRHGSTRSPATPPSTYIGAPAAPGRSRSTPTPGYRPPMRRACTAACRRR